VGTLPRPGEAAVAVGNEVGFRPEQNSKGDIPVDVCTALLYANSAGVNNSSQSGITVAHDVTRKSMQAKHRLEEPPGSKTFALLEDNPVTKALSVEEGRNNNTRKVGDISKKVHDTRGTIHTKTKNNEGLVTLKEFLNVATHGKLEKEGPLCLVFLSALISPRVP